jgi:DNA-binding transcriptional ArsR family regulator
VLEDRGLDHGLDGGSDRGLDRAYAALADPTRRALLVALRTGEARITDLAAPFPMTFAGVSRHVGVLESAGLVQRVVRGREHWLSIRPEGLSAAEEWIREQAAFWSVRADALASRLARREAAGDSTGDARGSASERYRGSDAGRGGPGAVGSSGDSGRGVEGAGSGD